MTLYEDLGLDPGASQADVKKAYRKLAMKHHPDKGGDPDTFKKISHAYDVLSDETKKKNYDLTGSESAAGFDMSDIFKSMGGMFGGIPQKRDDEHIVNITLDDIYHGKRKKLRVDWMKSCVICTTVCKKCKGTGSSAMQLGPIVMQQSCQECQAKGKSPKGCKDCEFKKYLREVRDVTLDIGPDTQNGERVRVEDMGITFIFHIIDNPNFTRIGQDLHCRTKLSFVDSVNGTIITVPHFSGPLQVSTQDFGIIDPRREYKLKGKGMKDGDLYILFDVQYPSDNNIKFTVNAET